MLFPPFVFLCFAVLYAECILNFACICQGISTRWPVANLKRNKTSEKKGNIAMPLDTTPPPPLDISVCDKIQMDNSGLRRRRDPHSDHIRTFSEWTPSLRNITTLRTTSLNRIISVIFVILTAASLLHSSGADPDLLRVSTVIYSLNITDN